eukprot:3770173-Pyramimonas_sp.AAC.1
MRRGARSHRRARMPTSFDSIGSVGIPKSSVRNTNKAHGLAARIFKNSSRARSCDVLREP